MKVDHATVKKLYEQWSPLLFFLTQRFGVPAEVGDEIVQEAFLRLVKTATPGNPADPKRFLTVTTRNLLIDERKKHRPQPVAEADVWLEQQESGTIGEGRLSRVAEVWHQLKPLKDFEVFRDYYQEGWTTEEIAQRRQLPPGTVRSKIHRLREKFRQLLDLA